MNLKQRKILVALDGSDHAFEMVKYMTRISPFMKMRLVLFNVFNKIPEYYCDIERQPNVGRRVNEVRLWEVNNEKTIKEYMEKARQKLLDAGFHQNNVQVKIQKRKSGIARDILVEANCGYSAVAAGRTAWPAVGPPHGALRDYAGLELRVEAHPRRALNSPSARCAARREPWLARKPARCCRGSSTPVLLEVPPLRTKAAFAVHRPVERHS